VLIIIPQYIHSHISLILFIYVIHIKRLIRHDSSIRDFMFHCLVYSFWRQTLYTLILF
jgi:hypothetical protein